MPLYSNALRLIQANLEGIQRGERVRPITIGVLTDLQLSAINIHRAAHIRPLPPLIAEVLFMGRHVYNSRVVRDGYIIDDVLEQIESAMDAS